MNQSVGADKIKVVPGSVQQFNSKSIIVVTGFCHSADFNRHLDYFMFKMDQDLKRGIKRETHFSCFYEHAIFRNISDGSCIVSLKTGKPYLEI